MSLLKVLSSFRSTAANVQGIAWAGGEVWLVGSNPGKLYQYQVTQGGVVAPPRETALTTPTPSGLAATGKGFFLIDNSQKRLFLLDGGLKVTSTFDLASVDWAGAPSHWQAPGSEITDLTWDGSRLYMACNAGMSSWIYCLKPQGTGLKVDLHFRARGANPVGLAFDGKQDRLWTLDGSLRAFRPSSSSGAPIDDQIVLPGSVNNVRGLDAESTAEFWTMDVASGDVYRLGR